MILDTSALLAAVVADDPHHAAAVTAMRGTKGAFVVPAGILAEVGYMVERLAGADALDAVLADLQTGAYALDCGDGDFTRIRQLVRRYADLPLGFADAAVIACAERTGAPVLTFDRRDFGVVAREATFRLVATDGPR